ncbi:MAG: ribulokinase [Cyclonatronaceae bacterium]
MESERSFVIGIDFGTDSVRALLVDQSGAEMARAVDYYSRWSRAEYCAPAQQLFRQHPLDFLESMEKALLDVVSPLSAKDRAQIKGISVDTTGSTPVAVNQQGTPLALCPGFEENPNAMFVLWKDHTAIREAGEINRLARSGQFPDFTKYVGGVYSSEWFWSKILHVLREDEGVRKEARSWVEHCDWITFELTGGQDISEMKRSRCAAGHKAMWHEEFNGLPSQDFLSALDPLLDGIRGQLYDSTHTSDQPAGTLSAKWADKLGLSREVVVGVGAFDAHMGAVGGEIQPYYLSKVMGTSTCDILTVPKEELGDKLVQGICGQVDGSVIPGMMGLEAGQSAFGDVYAWFTDLLQWPLHSALKNTTLISEALGKQLQAEVQQQTLKLLSDEAGRLEINEEGLVALDWLNGRRTPDANQKLKTAIEGLDLSSDAPRIFRSLVESTCFGAKAIVDRFRSEGIEIKGILGLGGVAKKSPFVMQTLANVLNMPIKIVRSEQTCALGAAMFAATASGIYASLEEAITEMGQGFDQTYHPDPVAAGKYEALYERYLSLGRVMETRTENLQRNRA